MGREELEVLKSGAAKRKSKRKIGIFIDGIGLDRATRRLYRKVDLSRLVSGLKSGLEVEVARYYTLVPYEDDARQFAFLDAVERAGLEVVTKRLPPKGVKRQVSMDVHLATDLVSFSMGIYENLAKAKEKKEQEKIAVNDIPSSTTTTGITKEPAIQPSSNSKIKRVAAVICPGREVTYAMYVANQAGVETSLVDFGLYGSSDGWRGVDRWVDLSTSETIWRD